MVAGIEVHRTGAARTRDAAIAVAFEDHLARRDAVRGKAQVAFGREKAARLR